MKKYYKVSGRGFANEYAIYSAETPEENARAEELCADINNRPNGWAVRVTAKEAHEITAHNRHLYHIGEATMSNPAGATEITPIAEYIG